MGPVMLLKWVGVVWENLPHTDNAQQRTAVSVLPGVVLCL